MHSQRESSPPAESQLPLVLPELSTGKRGQKASKAKDPLGTVSPLSGLIRQGVLPSCAKKETQVHRGQRLNQGLRAHDEAEAWTQVHLALESNLLPPAELPAYLGGWPCVWMPPSWSLAPTGQTP